MKKHTVKLIFLLLLLVPVVMAFLVQPMVAEHHTGITLAVSGLALAAALGLFVYIKLYRSELAFHHIEIWHVMLIIILALIGIIIGHRMTYNALFEVLGYQL